jgi:hypothetical protein
MPIYEDIGELISSVREDFDGVFITLDRRQDLCEQLPRITFEDLENGEIWALT